MKTTPLRRRILTLVLIGVPLAAVSGCHGATVAVGGSAKPSGSPATAAADTSGSDAALTNCDIAKLGESGFSEDRAHSGKLTATTYSAAADVQAALEYDQYQAGSRQVFLKRDKGRVDAVTSCVSMRFATAHLAGRFLLSYEALRKQAGHLVQQATVRPVPGMTGTVAYLERGQSFRGYHIDSTTVAEAAGEAGPLLYIASVSGNHPDPAQARNLLSSLGSTS